MSKCPYAFTAKSRAAMTVYLLGRKGYCDHYTNFPFTWNVKAYRVNYETPQGEKTNPIFDAQWLSYLRDNDDVYNMAVEDCQRFYADEKLWTSWPGADQGQWQFGFYGRSGGHLCLETWQGSKLYGRDFDPAEWLDSLSFSELRQFYRGIVCADQDFTQKAACEAIEFQLSFQRMLWEEGKEAELIEAARDLEESRPDMYACA